MARANEPLEVLVNGAQSEDREDIGEEEVDGEVRVGITKQVPPVVAARRGAYGRRI